MLLSRRRFLKTSIRVFALLSLSAVPVYYVDPVRADGSIGNVAAGTNPFVVAVNPISNKIYVANNGSNTVTVIDGTNNSTATIASGSNPWALAVNPLTNKIYVANSGSNNVTVIDGTNNSTMTVAAGFTPYAVAVNPSDQQDLCC